MLKITSEARVDIPCEHAWHYYTSFDPKTHTRMLSTFISAETTLAAEQKAREAVTALRDACNDWLDGADV